jgi:glycine betaine/proline transport system permease protein
MISQRGIEFTAARRLVVPAACMGFLFVLVLSTSAFAQEYGEELFKEIGTRSIIPLEEWIDQAIDWVAVTFMGVFDVIKTVINNINAGILWVLEVIPTFTIPIGETPVFIPVLALIVGAYLWWQSSIGAGAFGLISLWLIANLGLWPETLTTASLTLTAGIIALFFGIPIGILAGKSDIIEAIVRPILDFMQTLPVFVYLIPAVILFGLGPAPGVVATVIFALPPAVRLTSLGLRSVPKELVEAGEAFGCNDLQLLFKVQLPMAKASIMAGVNQTIMLSLSMVVIAALIGAGGLGGEVVRSIQRMLVGKGFVAGIAVVFLAIILDRATRTIGRTPS